MQLRGQGPHTLPTRAYVAPRYSTTFKARGRPLNYLCSGCKSIPARCREAPLKHWHETAAILDRVPRLAEAGSQAAIATVVRISGSAHAKAGHP